MSRRVLLNTAAWAAGAPRQVAVTIDDLPVLSVTPLDAKSRHDITTRLLDALRTNRVPAVDFVNEYASYGYRQTNDGAPDADSVALLQLWLEADLELGNHTFGHVDLNKTSLAAFEEDIARGEAVTGALLQQRGQGLRYFRSPYLHTGLDLDTRRDLERFLTDRGYRYAPVTIDTADYLFAAAYTRAAARGEQQLMQGVAAEYVTHVERVLEHCERLSTALFGYEIRQIVLLHATALNADHFGALAQMMQGRGYTFITLDDALRDEAYSAPDTYAGKQGFDWLARWALTKGINTIDNVRDDSPDIPEWVGQAAKAPDADHS